MTLNLEVRIKYDSFKRIKEGIKIYEVRLDRKPFSQLNLQDNIWFINPQYSHPICKKVIGIIRVPTLKDLFEIVGPKELGHQETMSYREWDDRIRKIYSPLQEEKYGVLGIKLS